MKKILYRSKKNRVVGGVCGGIGEYFDIDPTLIRLLAILTFFFGGSGIIAYIIGWIIIPQNPNENTEQHFKSEQKIVDMEEGPKTSESKFKTTEEYQSVENGKNNSAKNRNVFLGLIFFPKNPGGGGFSTNSHPHTPSIWGAILLPRII